MTTDLRTRLAEVIKTDRRVRALAQRRRVRRAAINDIRRRITALQEGHAAREALQREPFTNGNHQGDDQAGQRYIDVPGATSDVHAGGTRKPWGWLNGQPFYAEEA